MQVVTPADLRSMRILSGIGREELGKLLGVSADDVRQLERMRSVAVYRGHYDILCKLISDVNQKIDYEMNFERPSGEKMPPYIFTYPNDAVFREFDPRTAKWMHYNSVHWMYACRLQDAFEAAHGSAPKIVEIIPAQYQRHLDLHGAKDCWNQRVGWADAHFMGLQPMIDGMPLRQQRETQAA